MTRDGTVPRKGEKQGKKTPRKKTAEMEQDATKNLNVGWSQTPNYKKGGVICPGKRTTKWGDQKKTKRQTAVEQNDVSTQQRTVKKHQHTTANNAGTTSPDWEKWKRGGVEAKGPDARKAHRKGTVQARR